MNDTTTNRTTTGRAAEDRVHAERAAAGRPRNGAPRFDYDRDAQPTGAPSIGTLLKTLSRQSSTLVREEVALAKTEFNEKLDVLRASLMKMIVGAGLVMAAVLLVMFAVNRGLTTLLTPVLGLDIAIWLSPLALGLVVALIAYAMFKSAMSSVKKEGVVPHETVDTLKDDRDWAEGRIRA